MRNMKDSGMEWLGVIPEEWKIKKWKHILNERNEKNDKLETNQVLSLGYNYGLIPASEKDYTGGNKAREDLSDYKIVRPNDIVMNSMNIVCGSVDISKYTGCVSPVYYSFYTSDNEPRYFSYLFKTDPFERSLLGLGNGILIKESGNGKLVSVRLRIPIDKLKSLYLPLPSKIEQKKISDYLDLKCQNIDNIIKKTKESIDEYKTLRQTIIIEATTKGIKKNVPMKHSGIDAIGDIPESWRVTKLKRVCKKLTRTFDSNSEPLICSNKGEVILRGESIIGLISDNDDMYQGVSKGDLLIHGMDTWHGAVAVSSFNGKCTKVVHVCDSLEDKKFICYYLQCLAFQKVYKAISNGVRENTSDFRSWEKAGSIPVVLPPLKEQHEISNYIDLKCEQINKLVEQKEQFMEELGIYKKSLIYEYSTGKKEIK
ncbi:MAG: restriction endonuclease subunit S [Spirochaetaceae bacterium]|nr:restriction endonuclease subunit S [Spirochaetaceae bacterium]